MDDLHSILCVGPTPYCFEPNDSFRHQCVLLRVGWHVKDP